MPPILGRIRRLLNRNRLERELDREVAFHLERQVQDLVAAGVPPREAHRQAKLMLGGADQTKEACRDARGIGWIEDFFADCRYGTRMLRRSPMFTCAAVASLALGIGANTAIFSLVDLVILRMMPVREPARLVEFQKSHPTYGRGNLSYPMFEQLGRELRSFSGLLAQASLGRREIRMGGQAEEAEIEQVSGSYYEVLGIQPVVGRTFGVETDRAPGASPVAVISHNFWMRRFGGDASVAGKTFQLNQTIFTIVGVAPPGFSGVIAGRSPDIAVPISMDAASRGGRTWLQSPNFNWLAVLGRLRDGQSLSQARAEVRTFYTRMNEADAARSDKQVVKAAILGQRLELQPGGNGLDELRRRFAEPLRILMGVVALVLLIACANLANLLLAKSAARQREIAVRLAIGAGRSRVIRQLFTEGLLLSALGGALGVLLAYWLGNGLITMMSNGGRRMALQVQPDLRVLAFASLVSVAACLLFSLAPAIQASRTTFQSALAEVRGSRWRLGKGLIVAQVAISLVLVITAGLFGRTVWNMYSLDAGFDRQGVLMFSVNTQKAGYKGPAHRQVQERILRELRAVPGVDSAAFSYLPPISGGGWDGDLTVEGYTHAPGEDDLSHLNSVTPGYFRAFGTPVLMGREFDERDQATSPRVAVVNETFARYYFKGQSALGKWISLDGPDRNRTLIVGVVKNVKYRDLRREFPRTVYFAVLQENPWSGNGNSFVVRTANPAGMTRALEDRLQTIDKALRIEEPKTLEQHVSRSILTERMLATVGGFFGGLGLLVASIGIYGVMAFQVARRKKELGIRLAIGANPRQLVAMVLRETLLLVAAACAIGVAGALALTRLAEKMLFGIKPADPSTFALAIGAVTLAALAASYLPGRHAARLNPVETLRCD